MEAAARLEPSMVSAISSLAFDECLYLIDMIAAMYELKTGQRFASTGFQFLSRVGMSYGSFRGPDRYTQLLIRQKCCAFRETGALANAVRSFVCLS